LINYSTFADCGTLLFIRGLVFTQDGRSIVDTIGQRRFRVIERGMRDGYNTAKVELIRDHQIEQHEFNGLFKFGKKIIFFSFFFL
jgi:Lon protease-like protein